MTHSLLKILWMFVCVSDIASDTRLDQKLNLADSLNNDIQDVVMTTESVELVLKTTANIIYAALPNDLEVTSKVNNAQMRLLDLLISWKPPKSGRMPESYNIHVVPLNESNPFCMSDPYYGFIDNPLAVSWSVPPTIHGGFHDQIQILNQCSYRISLESNPHNRRSTLTTIYTVPDCVEGLCSCLHAYQLPRPEVRATLISKDTLNVTWVLRPSKYLANITKFVIGFGKYVTKSSHHHHLYNMSWVAETLIVQNKYFYSYLYVLPSSGQYTVGVYVTDNRKCSGPVGNYSVKVSDPVEQTLGTFSKTEMFWMVMLPSVSFILAMCVAVSVLGQRMLSCLKKRTLGHDIGMINLQHTNIHKATYKPISITSNRTSKPGFPSHQERSILYVEKEIEDARAKGEADSYEIGYNRLTFGREIGKGAFGRVFLAEAEAIAGVPGAMTVAVKKLKNRVTTDELEEFQAEIAMMKRVGRHPNIVTMLGCCTLKQPYCMVMEYVPCGDLLQYLRRLRVEYSVKRRSRRYSEETTTDSSYITPDTGVTVTMSISSGRPSMSSNDWPSNKQIPICNNFVQQLEYVLDPRELQSFAMQIARGMAFLEGKQITHRDLAARNILIDGKKTLKISDFGLSRSGIYVNTKKKKVPLRWLSVEAMRDSLYSSKSDVWAFGIVLWEIGTLGGFPYPTVADYDLLNFLLQGKRLEKPDNFSPELYSLMAVCWSHSADDRPSFADIVAYLDQKHRQQVYVDFSELKPDHEFPPIEQTFKITK